MRQPPVRQTDHIATTDQTVTAIDDRYSQPHPGLLDRSLRPRPAPRADPHATSQSPDPQGRLTENSLRYASRKHWGPITKAMREIYTSATVEAAEARFESFADDWEDTYPAMIRSWRNSWDEFVPFLEFPPELRRVVYTTNAIESLNARFRRAVRHRGHFPNEQAAMKVLYLIATARRKNRTNLTGKTNGWKAILNTLTVHYGNRIAAYIR